MEKATQLLEEGADINENYTYLSPTTGVTVKYSPLMISVMRDNLPLIKLLLRYHADVNFIDHNGNSVLDYTARGSDKYALLVEHGARSAPDIMSNLENLEPEQAKKIVSSLEKTPKLYLLWQTQSINILNLLWDSGVDINHEYCEAFDKFDWAKTTALIEACRIDNPEKALWLIAHGANVNFVGTEVAPNHELRTISALLIAAQHNHADVVAALIKAGARAGWQEALTLAREKGYTQIVELLQQPPNRKK